MQRLVWITAIGLLLLLIAVSDCRAQTNGNAESGKTGHRNRIEYHDFQWQVFHTPAFHIYFPKGADSLSAAVSREVMSAKGLIEKRMGGNPPIPKAIIIYPSLHAQYESSIGSQESVQLTVPTFIARGSRMVLHYEGNYEDLKNQIYIAMARATWEQELERSGSITAQVKGTVKSDPIPYWFKEGAIRYFALGWPLQSEESLRAIINTDSLASFFSLTEVNPALSGAAFCYYLSTQFNGDAPRQVYYQLRKGKSLPRVLRLVCKQDADSLYASCYSWYKSRFHAPNGQPQNAATPYHIPDAAGSGNTGFHTQSRQQIHVPFKTSKRGIILDYQLSPSGKKIALTVAFPDHKRCVYICDLNAGNVHKKIATYKLPPWLKNHQGDHYPLLGWNSSGAELTVTYPDKGKVAIHRFNSEGALIEVTPLPLIDGASSLTQISSSKYLLSAWLTGQSDLVMYDVNTDKYTPLTNDAEDDANPALLASAMESVKDSKGMATVAESAPIYFTSLRKGDTAYGQDTLHAQHGIYAVQGKKIKPILTDTAPYITYTQPALIDAQHLLLTATVKGRNKFALLSLHQTDGRRGRGSGRASETSADLEIISDAGMPYQYLPESRSIAFFKRAGDSMCIASQAFDEWRKEASSHSNSNDISVGPWLLDYQARAATRQKEDSILRAAKAAGGPSFLDGMLGNANSDKKGEKGQKQKKSDSTVFQYKPSKASPYVLQLYSAYFSARVNNDYFINRYQPYSAFQGSYKFPDVGGMVQGGLSDLFEHHHLSIAYRLPAGSEGSMFFTKYSNTAKRLDWSLAYYRNVESIRPDPYRAWVDADGRHYPSVANVKTHYYELGLSYPLSYYSTTGASLFVRKDRTVFLATDLYSLTFPALTDLWTGLALWEETKHLTPTLPGLLRGWKAKATCDVFGGLVGEQSALAALSISGEWHKPLYRYITLVAKAQAGFSGGDKKVLYNLGGVDNNLTPRIDSTVHFSQSAPYAFQTLITPLRAYLQNTLYGSRYCLLNADVYFPLFETLIPIETNFPSLNQLQLGLFSDVVAAGGNRRYSTSDRGWLYSHGFSARTILAGYPLRFDMAWPGSFSTKPVWYLSLSLL